ncbi:hypothetical protein ACF08W_31865 [Streptomyces sp. NPDC015144]|uniref:hypothetical protein n=1 Tax=Streptomyces sp. NPDC015144 TaxID=3364944 RepID=UPI0036FB4B60
MSDPHDPLRSLFKEAAEAGQSRARSAPVSYITARGDRVRRRRMVGLAVGACLVLSGAGAAVVPLLPSGPGRTVPATTPSPSPSPSMPTPSTSSPAAPETTEPPRTGATKTAPPSTSPPTRAPSTRESPTGTPDTPSRSVTSPPS